MAIRPFSPLLNPGRVPRSCQAGALCAGITPPHPMSDALHNLNYVAVLVIAIVGFLFGWIWYSLIFGRASKEALACGEAPEAPKPGMGPSMIKAFLFTFISTWGLALLIESHGTFGRRHGAEFGAAVGLLIVGARLLNDGVWARTPCKWTAIKVGHEVLLFAIQGAILGIWR